MRLRRSSPRTYSRQGPCWEEGRRRHLRLEAKNQAGFDRGTAAGAGAREGEAHHVASLVVGGPDELALLLDQRVHQGAKLSGQPRSLHIFVAH